MSPGLRGGKHRQGYSGPPRCIYWTSCTDIEPYAIPRSGRARADFERIFALPSHDSDVLTDVFHRRLASRSKYLIIIRHVRRIQVTTGTGHDMYVSSPPTQTETPSACSGPHFFLSLFSFSSDSLREGDAFIRSLLADPLFEDVVVIFGASGGYRGVRSHNVRCV